MKLVSQIYESFEKNQYTLGDFIDLSKVFDVINHSGLIKCNLISQINILQMHCIRGINLAWLRSYLANRKQYISLGHDLKTGTQTFFMESHRAQH